MLFVAVLVLAGLRPLLAPLLTGAAVQAWSTVFLAICLQATPFLVLGVVVSGAITAYVPESVFRRLPSRPALAVPIASAAGVLLPGCECSSVPVAAGLIARGVAPAAALSFLLSAPAVNPVVLVATAIAFPGHPAVVVARLLASLLASTVVGLLWAWLGRPEWLRVRPGPGQDAGSRRAVLVVTARHDFLHAGGFLVLGGLLAATLNVVVPRGVYRAVAGDPLLAVAALAGLAVVLAVCSEADAFVAASLTEFSLTAKLTFMVVGPMVDVKLVALQAGTFGRGFAVRFAPVVLGTAVLSALLVGGWLL